MVLMRWEDAMNWAYVADDRRWTPRPASVENAVDKRRGVSLASASADDGRLPTSAFRLSSAPKFRRFADEEVLVPLLVPPASDARSLIARASDARPSVARPSVARNAVARDAVERRRGVWLGSPLADIGRSMTAALVDCHRRLIAD